jgi:hypothetical protein
MRLRRGQAVWVFDGVSEHRAGRFGRYLGRGVCRVYLINFGVVDVWRGFVSVRRSRVDLAGGTPAVRGKAGVE